MTRAIPRLFHIETIVMHSRATTGIETIECNDDVLPFDIEDYLEQLNEFTGEGHDGSDAQDGSKA